MCVCVSSLPCNCTPTIPMHTCSDPFGLGADVVSTDANREDAQHDHELAEAVGRCIIEHTAAR